MSKNMTKTQYINCEHKGIEVPILQRFVEVNGQMKPITEKMCDKQNFCDKVDCPYNKKEFN